MKIDYFRSDIHVGKEVVASVQQWHVLVTSNSQNHPSSSFCDRLTCLKAAFPHPDSLIHVVANKYTFSSSSTTVGVIASM